MEKDIPLTTIENCAKEPIHIPGSIQEHGYFVAVDYHFNISHYSDNVHELLDSDEDLTGKSFSEIFDSSLEKNLKTFFTGHRKNEKYFVDKIELSDSKKPVIAHRTKSGYIIEIGKKKLDETDHKYLLNSINRILAVISEASELDMLFHSVAWELKSLLKIDRVMIYAFDKEWNGQVVEEAKEEEIEPYLGIHFPATDIPEQARKLYTQNWLRSIPDVNYTPVRIVPDCSSIDQFPLDLSDSVLRSTSPIHIQYLRNMGVNATIVMSLIVDGKLWGLVSCHHYSVHYMTLEVRYVCEMLAKILSNQIQSILHKELVEQVEKRQKILNQLNLNIARNRSIENSITKGDPSLMDLIDADGVVFFNKEEVQKRGAVPDDFFLHELRAFLQHRNERLYSTEVLTEAMGIEVPDEAAGILAIQIGDASGSFIIWFQNEKIKELKWGGNPNEKLILDPETMEISPRRSFEVYKEIKRNKSRGFNEIDLKTATELRNYIHEFNAFEKGQLEKLVVEKTQQLANSLQEVKQSKVLAEQNANLKSHLLASMSHEMKTPLNGIVGLTTFLKNNTSDPEHLNYIQLIMKSCRRLDDTITSILKQSEIVASQVAYEPEVCDVEEVLREVFEVLKPTAEEKRLTMEISYYHSEVKTLLNRHMLGQIFYNLLGNSIKYTDEGVISIRVLKETLDKEHYICIQIVDTGIGISQDFQGKIFEPFTQESMGKARKYDGVGLGLSLTKNYIDTMGGMIQIFSEKGHGSTFKVFFPIVK